MFLIFFALWLIFNAKFTLEICIFGIVLSALMYLFIWKVFGYKPKYDWLMVKLSLRGIKYFVILIWEIIKANIAVLKLIFTPKVEVKPKLVYFKVVGNQSCKVFSCKLHYINSGARLQQISMMMNTVCMHWMKIFPAVWMNLPLCSS